MGNRHKHRLQDSLSIGYLYTRKFKWLDTCVYCGEPATDGDHVYPLSLVASLKLDSLSKRALFAVMGQGLSIVPSCRGCNSLAGNKPFTSILEKRAYIQKRLAKRHKHLLSMPLWDEDELTDLGPGLRAKIECDDAKRRLLMYRVAHPHKPYWL